MPLVLIVDDSPTELHVMQKALQQHGLPHGPLPPMVPRAFDWPAK